MWNGILITPSWEQYKSDPEFWVPRVRQHAEHVLGNRFWHFCPSMKEYQYNELERQFEFMLPRTKDERYVCRNTKTTIVTRAQQDRIDQQRLRWTELTLLMETSMALEGVIGALPPSLILFED